MFRCRLVRPPFAPPPPARVPPSCLVHAYLLPQEKELTSHPSWPTFLELHHPPSDITPSFFSNRAFCLCQFKGLPVTDHGFEEVGDLSRGFSAWGVWRRFEPLPRRGKFPPRVAERSLGARSTPGSHYCRLVFTVSEAHLGSFFRLSRPYR